MLPGLNPRNICSQFLRTGLILAAAIILPTQVAVSVEGIPEAPAMNLQAAETELFVPAEYGEVVYQKNGHYPKQIFIIGQSHRSAITGQAGTETVKVQAEIYRIGEWLIRERKVELLLPEGFFQRGSSENASLAENVRESIWLDNQMLEAELSDTRRFVNADMLLNSSYNIRLEQVEDERLYRDVGRLLRQAREENSLSLLSQLDGLQDERTAIMLQNIPGAVERAFNSGKIGNCQAMFTIGLAHVGDIISSLQRGTFRLQAEMSDATIDTGKEASLKLLEQGYGVTVIIPRTLAGDEQILRMCKLDIK